MHKVLRVLSVAAAAQALLVGSPALAGETPIEIPDISAALQAEVDAHLALDIRQLTESLDHSLAIGDTERGDTAMFAKAQRKLGSIPQHNTSGELERLTRLIKERPARETHPVPLWDWLGRDWTPAASESAR